MAKVDNIGNLITAPSSLKNINLDTYVERLQHRPILPELTDNYHGKVDLWNRRFNYLKTRKSLVRCRFNSYLEVIKNIKSSDPSSFINGILKHGGT